MAEATEYPLINGYSYDYPYVWGITEDQFVGKFLPFYRKAGKFTRLNDAKLTDVLKEHYKLIKAQEPKTKQETVQVKQKPKTETGDI